MVRRLLVAVFSVFFWISPVLAQSPVSGSRVALVIGVDDYPTLQKKGIGVGLTLPSVNADVRAVSEGLIKAGFKVETASSIATQDLRARLVEFSSTAKTADAALVYFAGAGFDIEGVNFLLGRDFTELPPNPNRTTVVSVAVPIGDFVESVRQARQMGLVIVDAGREALVDPTRGFSLGKSSGAPTTAKQAANLNEVMILYSSSVGEPAADGEGISPFAEGFVRMIGTPGLELGLLARRVASHVKKSTGGAQSPEIVGSIGDREFYFLPNVEPAQFSVPPKSFAFTEQPRIALVIGNGDYNADGDIKDLDPVEDAGRSYLTDLANARNDASDLKSALESIRFNVRFVTDGNKTAIEDALISFGHDIRAAGPDALVVIYYAGHGIQIDGTNFLVPVAAELPRTNISDLPAADAELVMRRVAIPVNEIVDRLGNPGARGLNVLILDACRNNPWERRVRAATRGGPATRGLADVPIDLKRTMLSFATKPGDTSFDGDGSNGPFATALKAAIVEPGLNVRDMFDKVGTEVDKITNGRQLPFLNSPAIGGTCLGSCTVN